MKVFWQLPLHIFCILTLAACFNSNDSSLENAPKNRYLRLKTVHGDIIIRLNQQQAPLTSSRIINLVDQGFYNGLSFHRVIPGKIIQTGDPTGSGDGGSGTNLAFEETGLSHQAGVVSMARSPEDINSGDSQFFICLTSNQELDGKYAAFGKVTEGLDIAKKIVQGDKIITSSVEVR